LARGTQVTLDLLRWDEVDLTIEARLLDVIVATTVDAADPVDEPSEDEDDAAAADEAMAVNTDATDAVVTEAVAEGSEDNAPVVKNVEVTPE
jgi:exoribonuclease-2